ncbi:hypothetical protein QUF90_25955 [Desulfococcaceae bacterium HSG9]|nr:hypothetical protein [Desulfococcaceae bacterium HSG9]
MKNIKEITVFTASPGDVQEELDRVRQICEDLNADPMVKKFGLALRVVGWEDVFPSPERPQSIINRLVAE